MTALVIGASGHLGAHLCRALLADGQRARALVRPSSDVRGLAGLPLEVIHGDVLDAASLARAMAGCETAYHLGAPTQVTPDLARVVLEGTGNVLEQGRRAGLRRLVYTSSIVTVGYADGPGPLLDEASARPSGATPYHEAKWQAEQLVLRFWRQTGWPVVVVNPATVVGPLDFRVTPSNAPVQRCLDRGLPFSFRSGLTVVHAEDVARGHLLAMRHGRPGERYILGGDRVTIPDYFSLVCELCGRPRPRVCLPRWALLAAGLAFSALRGLGWARVPFTFTQARELAGKYGWYSSARAVRELGYSWRPAREAVADYVAWARSGRCPPGAAGPGTGRQVADAGLSGRRKPVTGGPVSGARETEGSVAVSYPWPPPPGCDHAPVWTGRGFQVAGRSLPLLAYLGGKSGWSDELTSFHEAEAGQDHPIDRASRRHALAQVQRHARGASPVVLEVGCSSGFFLGQVRRALPNALVIGADYVRGPLDALAAAMPEVPLLQFDLVRCPLPDESVDVAVLLNVLEHIEDHESAVRHLARVLRPGGAAVLEVPAGQHLYDVYDRYLQHYRRYRPRELRQLVERAGLRVSWASSLGALLYPAFWLVKRRNRRYLSAPEAVQKQVVARAIRKTGRSRALEAAFWLEDRLRKVVPLPFGVRCLLTCVKPARAA